MSFNYRFSSRKLVCSNTRFDVYFDALEFSDGTKLPNFLTVRPRVRNAQGVIGILILPELDQKIGLMRCWRHQFSCEIWQGPAGFMEPGESAQTAALRELKEETGLTCSLDELISLGSFCPDAALVEGRVALFLARCTGTTMKPFMAKEIGTGRLEYFSHEALKELLDQAENIGASTLVAGYRYLALIADGA